jgi:hypothetical protein
MGWSMPVDSGHDVLDLGYDILDKTKRYVEEDQDKSQRQNVEVTW